MKNLLIHAREHKYAIGGFNFNFYDDALGIVLAANKLNSPVYLMASEGCVKFMGAEHIVSYVNELKSKYKNPIILHLDHGKDMELIKKCIELKFDSIMYDGSMLPYEENISNTKMLARLCHEKEILIEGELGKIGGKEEDIQNDTDLLTNPDSVEEFVEKSEVDSLAVAIGNAHGLYKQKPKIDFERLEKINSVSKVPLVLHGGTGIPFEDIKKAITMGISKLNVGTEIKLTYIKGLKDYLNSSTSNDVRKLIAATENNVSELIKKYIYLLGSGEKVV